MNYNQPLYISFVLLLCMCLCPTLVLAQMNAFKYIPSHNADITRGKIFEFDLNSYGFAYERVIADHASAEIALFRIRVVEHTGIQTQKLEGFAAEIRYRYYFQTNPNYATFAPFEYYLAPTVKYAQMQTPTLNSFHEIRSLSFGAIVGYHYIMELYEDGFSFDINAGVNANIYDSKGFMVKNNAFKLTPRIGLSFGYTW